MIEENFIKKYFDIVEWCNIQGELNDIGNADILVNKEKKDRRSCNIACSFIKFTLG